MTASTKTKKTWPKRNTLTITTEWMLQLRCTDNESEKSWLKKCHLLIRRKIGSNFNWTANYFYNRKFGWKSKFWLKIELLVKNRNFGWKSKFLVEKRDFNRKSKFLSKIQTLVENWNFGRKSSVLSKIDLLLENLIFGRNSRFWSKIEFLVENQTLGRKCNFCPTIEILNQKKSLTKKCHALIQRKVGTNFNWTATNYFFLRPVNGNIV